MSSLEMVAAIQASTSKKLENTTTTYFRYPQSSPRDTPLSESVPLPPSYHRFSDLRTTTSSTHSTSPVMSPASSYHPQSASVTWENFKLASHAIPPVSAVQCADCIPECAEPLCSATSDFTSQCTEQCVVIACNDPNHADMVCDGSDEHAHCDLDCDSAINCTDCNGFDAFLQCCTDYHSYFSEQRAPSNPLSGSMSFDDSSLEDFLCACSQSGQHHQNSTERLHPSFSNVNSISPEESLPSSSSNSPISVTTKPAQMTPPHLTLPSPCPLPPFSGDAGKLPQVTRDTSQQTSMLKCMWGNCNASFSTLNELVGHVNLQHLRLPTQTSPVISTPPPLQLDLALSCPWRDCDLFHPPSSILASTFFGNPTDGTVPALANHLLQDHLGIKDIPQSLHSSESHSQNANGGVSHGEPEKGQWGQCSHGTQTQAHSPPHTQVSSHSPPLSHQQAHQPHHRCSDTKHECHWQTCGQSFDSCDDLTTHITAAHIGSGKAQYGCFWDGCNRNGDHGFTSKQKICRHLQSHTGHRPFQCSICQQNFSEAATLQQHMRRHTQEKPYVCDYPGCGKSFAITGALTIHKRTHNGHKPFKCTYCDRAFAESSNLSKHLRTHTGARPYTCAESGCGKSFARPDQLTRHMGVHRKKERGPSEAG